MESKFNTTYILYVMKAPCALLLETMHPCNLVDKSETVSVWDYKVTNASEDETIDRVQAKKSLLLSDKDASHFVWLSEEEKIEVV